MNQNYGSVIDSILSTNILTGEGKGDVTSSLARSSISFALVHNVIKIILDLVQGHIGLITEAIIRTNFLNVLLF